MFAVLKFGGKQFKISEGQEIDLDLIKQDEGSGVVLEDILFIGGENTSLAPKASVKCEVLKHFRAPKLVVFKNHQRSTFRKKKGHRQDYTRVKIKEIVIN